MMSWSAFATYWKDAHGKEILLFTALLLPLELLWPVKSLPLRNRLPHLFYLLLTQPLILAVMRWTKVAEIPIPRFDFLPVVNLAPFLKSIPFTAFISAFLCLT